MSLPPPPGGDRVDWRSVGLFLALAFAFAWAVEITVWATGLPLPVALFIATYAPAAGALVTRRVRGEGYEGLFGGFPRVRWLLIAWLVPAAVAAGSFVLALGSHLQRYQLLTATRLAVPLLLASLFVSPLITSLFTVGEEIGWRGHLLIRLLPLGRTPAIAVTGVVWGLWHAPLIWLYAYNYPGHPRLGVAIMCAFTIPTGAFIAWLRLRTQGIWAGTLAHATINSVAPLPLIFLTHADSLLAPPGGLTAIAAWFSVVGVLAWRGLFEPGRQPEPLSPTPALT